MQREGGEENSVSQKEEEQQHQPTMKFFFPLKVMIQVEMGKGATASLREK